MIANYCWLLAIAGICSGLLAGLLGIGGGILLVPILVALDFTPVQAAATSSLAIFITALSGSWQNWRMGYLDLRKVWGLGLPSLITAQIGAGVAGRLPPGVILYIFSATILANLWLSNWRKNLAHRQNTTRNSVMVSPLLARLGTGGAAGLLAGLVGLGGGIILVPLQMVLLNESIKTAVQTSLGVIVITALSACTGHALQGNVVFEAGLILGICGLLGVQVSSRFLPKLPEKIVQVGFNALVVSVIVYTLVKAIAL